jgi:hypothetical protein
VASKEGLEGGGESLHGPGAKRAEGAWRGWQERTLADALALAMGNLGKIGGCQN